MGHKLILFCQLWGCFGYFIRSVFGRWHLDRLTDWLCILALSFGDSWKRAIFNETVLVIVLFWILFLILDENATISSGLKIIIDHVNDTGLVGWFLAFLFLTLILLKRMDALKSLIALLRITIFLIIFLWILLFFFISLKLRSHELVPDSPFFWCADQTIFLISVVIILVSDALIAEYGWEGVVAFLVGVVWMRIGMHCLNVFVVGVSLVAGSEAGFSGWLSFNERNQVLYLV